MNGHTIILAGESQRNLAERMVRSAPPGAIVKIEPAKRTLSQNAMLWAMLSDVSRQQPQGRKHTPDMWKAIFMKAAGHEVQFMHGIDGEPFPVGFRSSRMTKQQMADLIDWISAYGAEHGVKFHVPETMEENP